MKWRRDRRLDAKYANQVRFVLTNNDWHRRDAGPRFDRQKQGSNAIGTGCDMRLWRDRPQPQRGRMVVQGSREHDYGMAVDRCGTSNFSATLDV
ncbi:MAG TPA: hypothetical protein VFP60_19690 [Pseudolabrys sp.]|nr:hypothetical protein [Pseudolabrys sp.]